MNYQRRVWCSIEANVQCGSFSADKEGNGAQMTSFGEFRDLNVVRNGLNGVLRSPFTGTPQAIE